MDRYVTHTRELLSRAKLLGPDLWNASYDSLVGYGDGVAALVAGCTVEQAQSRLGMLMQRVSGWMTAHGFNLALEKTEVVILIRRRIPTLRPISICKLTIESKPAIKYLGLTLDWKMSFFEQIKAAADRAAAGVVALSWLMANVGGRIFTRRRLLMGATQSVLLYDAEVWADALDEEVHRKRLAQVQRRRAEPAVIVIAGVIPVALLAKERNTIYRRKGENLREVVAREEVQLYTDAGELSPDNIVREMLKSAGSWNRIAHCVRALLITKKIELDRRRYRTVRGSLN